MSIPNPFRPVCGKGYKLLEEFLQPDVDGDYVNMGNVLTQSLTMADSLGFTVAIECVNHGDLPAWHHWFWLGSGNSQVGWYGVEQYGAAASAALYSNNSTETINTNLPAHVPVALILDKNGLSVNGNQLGPATDRAFNKTGRVIPMFSSKLFVKSFVFSAGGKKMIDVHAVKINEKKCLLDTVTKRIINVR